MANVNLRLCFAWLAAWFESWSNAPMEKDEEKAREILRRVEREADGAPFAGNPKDEGEDPVEIWGTRIGRGLGLLITLFLLLAFIVWFGAAVQ
jgi:hypothetical protein